ncbi:MAG: AAA family ATPase [Cyanobacteria bacterium P01_E01_bin.42]
MQTVNFQLTPCQNTALEQMQAFYYSEGRFFLLQGGAGTGKTTVIREFIRNLQKKYRQVKIAASAPTHKAVGVLEEIGEESSKSLHYATIHRLLGLKLEPEKGERVLREGRRSRIGKYDLVIVDEASMVSSALWTLLQQISQKYSTKFIFTGDVAQLPPIHETRSPIFDLPQQFSLTEVVRQAQDNPMMAFISAARAKVFDRNVILPQKSQYTGDKERGAWILRRSQWFAQLIRAFQSPKYARDSNYIRAIAWTNREVDYINTQVRNALYDPKVPFFEGERLIAKEAIHDPASGDVVLPSCAEVTVIDKPQFQTSPDGIDYWRLRVEDEEDIYRFKVPDPSARRQMDRHLSRLAEKSKQSKGKNAWGEYWDFRNQWANLKPCYGITSHQSQGSTYENAFVCDRDISRNPSIPEQHQSRYVAFSRARSRLFVL